MGNYVRPSYLPRLYAERTAELIRKAPAGGPFHDATVELAPDLGAGFTVRTPSGDVVVTFTPVVRFDTNAPTPYHYHGPSYADAD